MVKDSLIYSLIGFIIAIIPYLILICLVDSDSFDTMMSISGILTGLINAYYFRKNLTQKNASM